MKSRSSNPNTHNLRLGFVPQPAWLEYVLDVQRCYTAGVRLFVLLLTLTSPALASAPDLFGYGARASGLAGAVVSTARGHAAVYHNPGTLGFEERPSFAFGYQRADFDLTLDGADHEARAASATFIGFDLPLPLGGLLARRIALGTAFVIPTSSVLLADVPAPDTPRFALVENRAQTVSLAGAIGVRFTDWLGMGIGFLALSELDGAIDVAPNAEGRIGSSARDQLVADYALLAGLSVKLPWAEGAVGAAYRGESMAEFDLPITADLGDRFPLPVPTLEINGVAQYDPEQVGFEASGELTPGVRVAAGGTWKRWSAYPNPIEYTAVPDDFPEQPDPDFDDTFEWRVGVEWTLEVDTVVVEPRLGWQLTPSPAPAQSGLHSYLDNDRQEIAFGAGVRWEGLRAELAGQWHHLVERSHTKTEGDVEITHKGDVLGFSFELGVDL